MAELTYIIPVFNGAQSIKRTIASIIEQPGRCSKIVVVDDGSTDGTLDAVSGFGSILTLLRQPNAGPSVARNLGLRACDTEIVCFIDADDYVIGPHSQSVEKIWHEDLDMVIGMTAEGNDDKICLANRNKYDSKSTNHSLLREFISGNCVQTSTICWSTTFIKKLGGWDETLLSSEDVELAIRALIQNSRLLVSNAPGWVVWCHHSGPERMSHLSVRFARGQVRYHQKLLRLLEEHNCDPETVRLFFHRCIEVGRFLYLNGFHQEAVELCSIAWTRGYREHPGPKAEKLLARIFGPERTLATREFVQHVKRGFFN